MSEEEFNKLLSESLELNDSISKGICSNDILDKINNSIEYLNIELEFEVRENPTDQLSYYYQKIELCWIYYKLRDYYFTSQA